MKILTNKKYGELVGEVKALEMELNEERRKNGRLKDERNKLLEERETKDGEFKTKIASSKNKNMQLEEENKQLKEENHKLLGAKGGYVKEINKLKKKIEELEFKLKESMTDKHLVKKLPTGRRPKGPAMKLTSHAVVSNITRKMHNND